MAKRIFWQVADGRAHCPLGEMEPQELPLRYNLRQIMAVDTTDLERQPEPGDIYDPETGTFSPPPGPSPEEILAAAKAAKLAEMYSYYQQAKTAIVWYNGRGYDADPDSRNDFFEVKELVRDDREDWIAGGQVGPEPTRPYRVYIEGDGKQVIEHTLGDFIAAARAGAEVQMAAFLRFDSRRTEIAAAETAEDVEAITW